MNVYIKTPECVYAVRASRSEVNKLPQISSGEWSVIPATKKLRKEAYCNINVRVLRIIEGNIPVYL